MGGVARLLVVAVALSAVGCSAGTDEPRGEADRARTPSGPRPLLAPEPSDGTSGESVSPGASALDPHPQPSDGRPRRARLSIPAIDVRDLLVVPYRGRTDDGPGTRIQDRGHAAAPFGPRGGVGPGGVGNYQVTAHRTSSTRAFEFLPQLRKGDKVLVEAGRTRYVYRVVSTRRTSFRSPRSLAEQRAAVPGRPGKEPTRAMITLSTCLTREDHAAGNFWSDRFDNPEHRVDKIGVLVRAVPLG